jgi:peptidoglycan/xylan/chitin deacetylase (PgdA/CDA1 family)
MRWLDVNVARWIPAASLAACLILCAADSQVRAQEAAPKGDNAPKKQIAITFDELPAARAFGDVDREAITYLVLDALRRHRVRATGFVVGEQIENGFDLLGQWLNEGHTLGSMTFSDQDYNLVAPAQFISEVDRGTGTLEPMLKGFGQKKRYFRYPYLHYGDTVEKRRAARAYLQSQKYVVCPATVMPEDYLYDLSLTKLGKTPDSVKYEQLLNDYLNHVLDEVERQENLAVEVVRRPVRQILTLRANRLNAVFLDALLTALEDAGYGFVTLEYALKDQVYSTPEAYYDLKGVGYLEMILHSNPDMLPAK